MQVRESLSGSIVVLDEPSEARDPCEGSLDNPSPWEHSNASRASSGSDVRAIFHLHREHQGLGTRPEAVDRHLKFLAEDGHIAFTREQVFIFG